MNLVSTVYSIVTKMILIKIITAVITLTLTQLSEVVAFFCFQYLHMVTMVWLRLGKDCSYGK